MSTPQWFEQLLQKKFIPGTVECSIEVYKTVKTPAFKEKILLDIKKNLLDWAAMFEVMQEQLKNDPIAAPTKNEKEFYKWVKSIVFTGSAV